jgi:hypothetical protein
MEEIMKFVKNQGLVHAALLCAGLLTMPAIAQQEVSPDHFDDHPAVAQGKKPAAQSHKAAGVRTQRTAAPVSAQTKSKPVAAVVLKADAGKGQASQNPR